MRQSDISEIRTLLDDLVKIDEQDKAKQQPKPQSKHKPEPKPKSEEIPVAKPQEKKKKKVRDSKVEKPKPVEQKRSKEPSKSKPEMKSTPVSKTTTTKAPSIVPLNKAQSLVSKVCTKKEEPRKPETKSKEKSEEKSEEEKSCKTVACQRISHLETIEDNGCTCFKCANCGFCACACRSRYYRYGANPEPNWNNWNCCCGNTLSFSPTGNYSQSMVCGTPLNWYTPCSFYSGSQSTPSQGVSTFMPTASNLLPGGSITEPSSIFFPQCVQYGKPCNTCNPYAF